MKLLLTSFGFQTPEIINAAIELTGKQREDISVAIINEAHIGWSGDKHWMIGELNLIAETFPGTIDVVSIQSTINNDWLERLKAVDLIYVVGGTTDYLMQVFERAKMKESIVDLLKDKVYVGSSAGSMVLARRATGDSYERVYGEKSIEGITSYLNLLPFVIMPHLDSDFFTKSRKETILNESRQTSDTIIALRDDQALIITDEGMQSIGGEPLIVQNGQEHTLESINLSSL